MELEIKITYRNERLQELRLAAGLSQSQLADAADINIRTLQEYERGARNLNGAKLATLLRLCKVLKCSLSDIITDPETKALLKDYEQRERLKI